MGGLKNALAKFEIGFFWRNNSSRSVSVRIFSGEDFHFHPFDDLGMIC